MSEVSAEQLGKSMERLEESLAACKCVTRFALHLGLRKSGAVFDAGVYLGLRPRL